MIILVAVFSLVFLVSLLTYTLFCYEETNQSGKPLTSFLGLCARTFLGSMASEAVILCLLPFGLIPRLWRTPTTGKPLILMVHGLFHNPTAWIAYRYFLRKRGYATACFGYPSWGTDWESTVNKLQAWLEEIQAARPDQDIHLIGHSMGGLLLCAALSRLADSARIRSLITLGTPFGGSKLAPFALSSLGRYLEYNGETVRAVAACPLPAHVRALALFSPADNMVLPALALRCPLPGCQEMQTTAVSHIAMLYSSKIFRQVLAWIKNKEAGAEKRIPASRKQ